MIKSFEEYGEYRKGSDEYGPLVNDVMLFLRNYKVDNNNNLMFKVKDVTFDIDKLYKLKNFKNKNKMISFDFRFLDRNKSESQYPTQDGYVEFFNLNKKDGDRPWENKSFYEKR